jgi:hypothetical protein
MTRVHVICEGQTEVNFINELLIPHFSVQNIFLNARKIGKANHKGGNVNFDRVLTDVRNSLKEDTTSYCTTFFDFYGLSSKFVGLSEAKQKLSIDDKFNTMCNALNNALTIEIGDNYMRRFIPYIQLYEFEGLLFSHPKRFAEGIYQPKLEIDFEQIRRQFVSPEEINDSVETAPSKRIKNLYPFYEKPTHSVLAALEIGLPTIREKCRLFDGWIISLENLVKK